MKITVQHVNNSFNRSYRLKYPGATFGRSHENQIVLPDPSVSISLFQAVIKLNEVGQVVIRNLAATPILIGNQSLWVGQSIELQSDSEFICGNFKFQFETESVGNKAMVTDSESKQTESPTFKVPTVMPMPGTELITLNVTAPSSALETHPIPQLLAQDSPLETHTQKASEIAESFKVEDLFEAETTPHLAPKMTSAATEYKIKDEPDLDDVSVTKERGASVSLEDYDESTTIVTATTSDMQPEINMERLKITEVPSPSIFDDLFSGNGVVPIGAEPDYIEVHPFEMRSATARNSSDPLTQINGIDLDEDLSKDPLERLSHDGIEHQQRDIFHDTRPSTLFHHKEDEEKNNRFDDLDKIFSELESYAKH